MQKPHRPEGSEINSKWIKELNLRPETIKENRAGKLYNIVIGDDLDMAPNVQVVSRKIDKWNYIKLKSFCVAKKTINRMKRQPTEWKRVYASHISYKELISKYVRNSYNSIAKKSQGTKNKTE